MKVLFFAQSRGAAGRGDYILEVKKPVTESEFWALVTAVFPALEPHQKTARLARGESYLQKGELLGPNDEVAVIPPVSGG